MNPSPRARIRVAEVCFTAAILTLALSPAALAGNFTIDWWTVDSGGAMSSRRHA
ncbi:MAG: hypothetical protein IH986_12315 [Planctomycetes bacterium]|nr:hypothetical protein [Planctomycetota bacterium]